MDKKAKNPSPEDLKKRASRYFNLCDGEADENGNTPKSKPYTLSGLALALGFDGRRSMLEFASDALCGSEITRAVTKVEEYAETRLYDRDGLNGAKFVLSAAFAGWGAAEEAKGEATLEIRFEGEAEDFVK